ncbi:MAG TPA: hypothetical protein VMU07_03700 [Candidatus Paceibacterota bacterium]|nr:hypothetical protein [Candidatus Paceibacterota bacterium]
MNNIPIPVGKIAFSHMEETNRTFIAHLYPYRVKEVEHVAKQKHKRGYFMWDERHLKLYKVKKKASPSKRRVRSKASKRRQDEPLVHGGYTHDPLPFPRD